MSPAEARTAATVVTAAARDGVGTASMGLARFQRRSRGDTVLCVDVNVCLERRGEGGENYDARVAIVVRL